MDKLFHKLSTFVLIARTGYYLNSTLSPSFGQRFRYVRDSLSHLTNGLDIDKTMPRPFKRAFLYDSINSPRHV